MNKQYREYLHLFVLVAFAVAQPIYDLLGKNPEFFVAHAAQPTLIIIMMVVLSFGLATILVLAELVARLFGERMRSYSHLLFVFSLAVLFVLPLIKHLHESDFLIAGSAILLSGIFTALYARLQAIQMFITVLIPAVVVFPILFLWTTPVGRLVIQQNNQPYADEIQIKNPVTTIVVVFDEFSTTALLDAERQIDPIRFPNIAALAAESLWFPNAIAASQSTVEAIPSIVTGLNPRPKKKLVPTVTDYPHNLFTMLGRKYDLDVFESVTTLCPKEPDTKQNNNLGQDDVSFFSDLLVIYSHVLAPVEMAKKLPSLEARWTGFGSNLLGMLPSPDLLKKEIKREDQLAQFLSQIKASSAPKLYFLHTELPHIPYHYLASGQYYSDKQKLPEGIISDTVGWIGEEPLIVTAYSRYLQQVGYVDNFLGKLRKQLISEGVYDDSLLIITADHGVAFESQQSRRLMKGINNSEIFKIPLIVKLPKQKHGRVDERIVSSIDILPTIIDVLKVNVPWQLDGLSMATDSGSPRKGIDFVGLGHLGIGDIVGFPRLEWQVKHFGTHTALDRLVPKGPFNELAGRDLAGLQVGSAVADMLLISNNIGYFASVDLKSHFLPLLFKGSIEGTHERNLPLAIAVNGQIWATTNTSEWDGRKNYFSVLFPTTAVLQGQNNINIYLIEESREGLVLRPINENQINVKLQQTQAGDDTLIFANGNKVIVETSRDNIEAYLDWLTLKNGMLVFEGWAADLVEKQPVSDILIFKGDKLVWQIAPTYIREGLAESLNWPSSARCGYLANIPLEVLEPGSGDISVVAISKDKRAFRIHIKDLHKELIHTILGLGPKNENRINVKLQQTQAGNDTLIFANGNKVIVETSRNNMDAYLDWLTLKDGMLVFEGWAADLVEKQPASDILIFKGDKLVWQIAPIYIRDGLAESLNWPSPAYCGYLANIPLEVLEPGSGDISLVAIFKDKRAFRIHIKDLHKELIHTRLGLEPKNENRINVKLQQTQAGDDTLIFANGNKVLVETSRDNMDAYLDWLTLKDGMLVFEGWAADLVEKQPASDILIFKGDQLVWQVAPTYIREGLAESLNWPSPAYCGYLANIPLEILEPGSGDISVVAISKDKRAFRIHIKDLHKELIRTSLIK